MTVPHPEPIPGRSLIAHVRYLLAARRRIQAETSHRLMDRYQYPRHGEAELR